MKKFLILLFVSFIGNAVSAQVPYFASSPQNNKLYGYTSVKFRPGINKTETYNTFQYGVTDYVTGGIDYYTSPGSAYMGFMFRTGYKVNQWFGIGCTATPSFNLNDNFKFDYFTGGLFMNGSITRNGNLFWCSNTWFGVNRDSEDTISQWTYLGYTIPTVGGQSVTPMVGAIHSWKFDQDADLAVGAYYTIGKWNIYLWGNDFFKDNPRVVVGIDFTL